MIIVFFCQIIIWISSVTWKSQNTRTELTLGRGSPNLPKQGQDRIGKVANLQEPWFQGYSNQELQSRLQNYKRDPAKKQLLQWKKTDRRPSGPVFRNDPIAPGSDDPNRYQAILGHFWVSQTIPWSGISWVGSTLGDPTHQVGSPRIKNGWGQTSAFCSLAIALACGN